MVLAVGVGAENDAVVRGHPRPRGRAGPGVTGEGTATRRTVVGDDRYRSDSEIRVGLIRIFRWRAYAHYLGA